MKKIAVINQKGGSGKTATAIITALSLSARGKRVLMVDCDPQGGLTGFFVSLPELYGKEKRGLFDVVTGNQVDPLTIDSGGLSLDLLPADYRLDKVYATMGPYDLEKIFDKMDYDYTVLDCPPTVQGISRAAAMIADTIIIPADISRGTIRPTLYTLNTLKEIKKAGKVYLIGKDPAEDQHGFTADTAREFISKLGRAYGGTIQKSITIQKIVADRGRKWTAARIEKQLKPILQAVKL